MDCLGCRPISARTSYITALPEPSPANYATCSCRVCGVGEVTYALVRTIAYADLVRRGLDGTVELSYPHRSAVYRLCAPVSTVLPSMSRTGYNSRLCT